MRKVNGLASITETAVVVWVVYIVVEVVIEVVVEVDVIGARTVVILLVTPMQEQALE